MRYKTFRVILAASLVLALGGGMAAGERAERGRSGGPGRLGKDGHAQRWDMPGDMRADMSGPRFGARHRFPRHHFSGPGRLGPGFGGFALAGWPRLALSPEQKTQAIEVLTTHFRAGLEAGLALQDARAEVRDLRRTGSADSERIISAHRALGEARGRLEAARLKAREDFTAILTPEQREKFSRFGREAARRGGRGWGADTDADEDAGLDPELGLEADSDAGLDAPDAAPDAP